MSVMMQKRSQEASIPHIPDLHTTMPLFGREWSFDASRLVLEQPETTMEHDQIKIET
jgi:hypothetical protein